MTVGKEGISAKIICDSIGENSPRMTTFELEYPRFIHAELMTHRMLSKNCASSRAIPVKTMTDIVTENPAMPVWWGKNQPGMSAKEELNDTLEVRQQWKNASISMVQVVSYLNQLGLHKQIANRITEPWQRMKTVISGTEWANLLWLRDHEDAQPEFAELAKCIREEFEKSTPVFLQPGQWHLPYVNMTISFQTNEQKYYNGTEEISLEDAKKVSASCCAQVSYRKLDDSLQKSLDIYDRLVSASRVHASPFEHQATPMFISSRLGTPGVTHMTSDAFWSGNLREWIQYRQLIPNHSVW